MSLDEIKACEFIAYQVEHYRNRNDFRNAACWMDEWAYGYFCALRDMGVVNVEQWEFLCDVFTLPA